MSLNSIPGDERDFFVPEDLVLVMWQEVYGRDEPLDIPYVQVNTNLLEVSLNTEIVCVVCRDNAKTHLVCTLRAQSAL